MDVQEPSEDAAAAFEAVAETLAATSEGVARKRMFGSPCLTVNGKGFATFSGTSLALKLAGEARATALSLDGAVRWDPSKRGRAMREWVAIPAAQASHWLELAQSAAAFVRAQNAKHPEQAAE